MSKLDLAVEACIKQMRERKIPVNKDLIRAVAKSLGPSLYKRDARTVATGQKKELETIRRNFLIKKLGCEDSPKLDRAMDKAIEKIGRSNRQKLRPVFYYLLVRSLRKTDLFI